MDVRPITAVEEMTELTDDVQIPVIDNGTLKRISKSNAKFGGGGSITTFTLIPSDVSTQATGAMRFDGTVVNENGEEVTVEEAIATWENGLIRFKMYGDGEAYELPINVIVSGMRTGIQFDFSGMFATAIRISYVIVGEMSGK